LQGIESELKSRCAELEAEGKGLEASRLKQRTENDILLLRMVDTCKGIENYSRHLSRFVLYSALKFVPTVYSLPEVVVDTFGCSGPPEVEVPEGTTGGPEYHQRYLRG
jgi:hypothetical protein